MSIESVATAGRRELYLYTNICHPKVTKYPMHLATYNGRTQTVRKLLSESEQCAYQLASDVHDEQPNSTLFMAIARQHSDIAHLYLDIMCADLMSIEQHFDRIIDDKRVPRFWLRERILVAFGQDHIDFVLAQSTDVRADPVEMGDRTGLLILLKPNNNTVSGVVWLTTRQSGADRIVARIVAHIYGRGGELSVARKEWLANSLFDVAARMNQLPAWRRMHDMFGDNLDRRAYVKSFRLLAEHEETDTQKTERFDELCQTFGGFAVKDIFSNGDELNILYDAVAHYQGDSTILEHLVSIASLTRTSAKVINQIVDDLGCDRSLISVAFELERDLPWKMLPFKPDLIATCTVWWDTPANRYITDRPFDSRVHELILEQLQSFGRIDDYNWELLQTLILHNWSDTVRGIYELDPTYKELFLKNRDNGVYLLERVSRDGNYEILEYLLSQHEIESTEKMIIIEAIASVPIHSITESLWDLLSIEHLPDNEIVSNWLISSLKCRNLRVYQQLLQLVPGIRLKDVLSANGENLLFAAIWDNTKLKEIPYIYIETESPEFIDSEDDVESSAHKSELNLQRNPTQPTEWSIIDVDVALEQQYQQLFRELLDADIDWRHINKAGQNLAHIAVDRNNMFALNTLISLGIDTSVSDLNGNLPMHHVNSVESLVALPIADVHCLNQRSENAMLSYLNYSKYMTQNDNLLVRFIEAGTDVNQANCDGDTPLHLVNSARITQMFLDGGANSNAKNVRGELPAFWSLNRPDVDIDKLRVLFGHPGHDLFLHNDNNASSMLSRLVSLTEADFATLLGSRGVEKLHKLMATRCNHPPDGGFSILSYIHRPGANLPCLRMLLDLAELDVQQVVESGPIFVEDEGRWLIHCGAHISRRTDKRPLDWTQCSGDGGDGDYLAQLQMFIAAGFDAEITNRFGETALQWYGGLGHGYRDRTVVMARLLAAGANYRLLTMRGHVALADSVFRSFYEWDEEKGVGVLQQVFQCGFAQISCPE